MLGSKYGLLRSTVLCIALAMLATGAYCQDVLRRDCTWCPDGRQFAFTNYQMAGGDRDIWIANMLDRTVTRLTEGECPDWSPDGKAIVFVRDRSIYVRVLASGDERPLTSNKDDALVGQPSWSPDGTRIAYVASRGQFADIWVMNAADGSNKQCVLRTAGMEASPNWSPDGEMLVYHAVSKENTSNIFILKPGGIPIQVAVTDERNLNITPSWSRAGGVIAYDSTLRNGMSGGLYLARFTQERLAGFITALQAIGLTPALPGGGPSVSITTSSFPRLAEAATYSDLFTQVPLIPSPSRSLVGDMHGGRYIAPEIAPDGTQLLATYAPGGANGEGICLISADGLTVQQLIAADADRTRFATDPAGPTLQVDVMEAGAGKVLVSCKATDDQALQKVVVFANGKAVAVFCRQPYEYTLDVASLRNGGQECELDRVLDQPAGRQTDKVKVPAGGAEAVVVYAYDVAGNVTGKQAQLNLQ